MESALGELSTANDPNFSRVKQGEVIGVLGHNGAGKTTMLNMLVGLYPTTGGTAHIYGNNLSTDMDKIHALMGGELICWQCF